MTTAILNLIASAVGIATIVFLAVKADRYRNERDRLRREAQTQQTRLDFREMQIKRQATRIADLLCENTDLKESIEASNRILRAQVDPDAPTLDVRPEEL